jgi:hypothetical protein
MKSVRHILLLAVLLSGTAVYSQIDEFGVFGGVTNYFGDLNTVASFKYVRQAAGGFYRYNIKYRGAWRNSFTYGRAEFFDNSVKDVWNQQRNLNFRTDIFEVSSMIEFNFFKYDKDDPKHKHWFTPYIATGLAIFFFNPQGQYNGNWYYLQPLGTEGQNDPSYSGVKKYRLYSFAIPFVGGFKFSVLRYWNIALEGGLRQTFTKYLDDVSGKYPTYPSLPGGSGGLAAALSNPVGTDGERYGRAGYQRGDGGLDKYLVLSVTISYTIMKPRCPSTSGNHTYGN